jgi:predicted NUDIX family NTP pyrophosphohydrolase
MKTKLSAGLLMYRRGKDGIEVLLVHPGGPYFKNKDDGAWTIPKGEPGENEDLLTTAIREFQEETGIAPTPPFRTLESIRQKAGKVVHAWAFEGDCDPAAIQSNTFSLEWPPRSGRFVAFPEIDRAEFFDMETAKRKMNAAQVELLERMTLALQQA